MSEKMNKIVIKKISTDDYNSWKTLWKDYLNFYNTKLCPEIFHLTFSRIISETNLNCNGYNATIDKKAVGIVHCIYHMHFWQKEDVCYLQDLFVSEKYRNRGIARELVKQVYAVANQRGAKGVYWMTQDFNTTARKLYDKIGVKTPFIKYTHL